MAHTKKASPRTAHTRKGSNEKRRYTKPTLRRLGSVRELTQTTPTNFK